MSGVKKELLLGQLHKDTDLAAKAYEIHTFIMMQVMMVRIQNDLVILRDDLKSGLFRDLNLRRVGN